MRYVGGKYRIRKWLAEEVIRLKGERDILIEPFLGRE